MLSDLVLASGNPGKLAEFQALLAPYGLALVSQTSLGIDAPPEPHSTFVENALLKARHASAHSRLPALADDSGICVEALQGAPGVYSARYAQLAGQGSGDAANNRWLIQQLTGRQNRNAYYYCVLVLVRSPQDPQPLIADAIWPGQVHELAQGNGGFGYDPHFYLPDQGQTAAQLSAAKKNQLSHRAQALRNLIARMQAQGLVRSE